MDPIGIHCDAWKWGMTLGNGGRRLEMGGAMLGNGGGDAWKWEGAISKRFNVLLTLILNPVCFKLKDVLSKSSGKVVFSQACVKNSVH